MFLLAKLIANVFIQYVFDMIMNAEIDVLDATVEKFLLYLAVGITQSWRACEATFRFHLLNLCPFFLFEFRFSGPVRWLVLLLTLCGINPFLVLLRARVERK